MKLIKISADGEPEVYRLQDPIAPAVFRLCENTDPEDSDRTMILSPCRTPTRDFLPCDFSPRRGGGAAGAALASSPAWAPQDNTLGPMDAYLDSKSPDLLQCVGVVPSPRHAAPAEATAQKDSAGTPATVVDTDTPATVVDTDTSSATVPTPVPPRPRRKRMPVKRNMRKEFLASPEAEVPL